jgi:hypothetical protein
MAGSMRPAYIAIQRSTTRRCAEPTKESAMSRTITSKVLSFGFAAMVTLSILGGLDALATTGQSADALLAQHGPQQTACVDPARAPRS